MHELSLCESIAELVVAAARQEGVARVTRVTLEIGSAAPVDPEALRFCFPLTVADTPARDAELVIERVALRVRCQGCGAEYEPPAPIDPCPACGGFARSVLAGREMRVASFAGE